MVILTRLSTHTRQNPTVHVVLSTNTHSCHATTTDKGFQKNCTAKQVQPYFLRFTLAQAITILEVKRRRSTNRTPPKAHCTRDARPLRRVGLLKRHVRLPSGRCLFSARLPLPGRPGIFWTPFYKDPVGFGLSTPPGTTYLNAGSRTCPSQNCLSRAASLNTSAHGAWGKNPGALPSRRSIALLLRMRLKCSPRHLSSGFMFKCHASGKSRAEVLHVLLQACAVHNWYLSSARSCVHQAQQCVWVHLPTRVPDIPIAWSRRLNR